MVAPAGQPKVTVALPVFQREVYPWGCPISLSPEWRRFGREQPFGVPQFQETRDCFKGKGSVAHNPGVDQIRKIIHVFQKSNFGWLGQFIGHLKCMVTPTNSLTYLDHVTPVCLIIALTRILPPTHTFSRSAASLFSTFSFLARRV